MLPASGIQPGGWSVNLGLQGNVIIHRTNGRYYLEFGWGKC